MRHREGSRGGGREPSPKRPPYRVLLLTNVKQAVLQAYLEPLAALEEVAEVVVIRDRADVEVGPKVRVIAPHQQWPLAVGLKLICRGLLMRQHVAGADLLMTLHWFPDGPMVVRWGRRLGIPVVANIIGSRAELIGGGRRIALAPLPDWAKHWAETYQRRWLNRASAVTYTGQATADWFRAAGIMEPEPFVLHAAVESGGSCDPESARTTDVAYIGRIHPDKRVDRLFATLAALGRGRPGTIAEIVGMGSEDAERFPAYHAARLALGTGLRLYQRVDSVEPILGRSKVLLLTSDTEGRTLAVLEAMAAGAVPVVTDVGDLAEALGMGKAGIVVPLEEEEESLVTALAHQVITLLKDERRRQTLADYGSRCVRREHARSSASQDWRRVIEAVTGGGVK